MQNISLLLGAGFSVNRGYPTAAMLNEKLTKLTKADFCVSTGGSLCWLSEGQKDPFTYSSYYTSKMFTLACIEFYSKANSFNYEEFYDFYKSMEQNHNDSKSFNTFCDEFRQLYHCKTDNLNLLNGLGNIYNQLIAAFLVDSEGKKFYDPGHLGYPTCPGYTGFLNCLQSWGEDHIVHIHTLNHDLFFEIFKSSDWLKGELDDGFKELGSSYYGDFQERFKVRLPYFANFYEKRFRLYKLHGSIDQYPFHLKNFGIDGYIKIKLGIGTDGLYKEVENEKGELQYVNDWINYHSDFLSGTTSKILRYREPWYYEKVFNHLEKNLIASKNLVIIGYGCGDTEINNLIEKYYDKSKHVFIVEPFPHQRTYTFCENFNAKLIVKNIDNLSTEDFIIEQ